MKLSLLDELEADSIHIIREAVGDAERPVMLYSAGKDSSVLLHLAKKAFYPAPVPLPLLHVDTGLKFEEMITLRNRVAREPGIELRVYKHPCADKEGVDPAALGTVRCCGVLKTEALLTAITDGRHDLVLGGGRREEERSRAKERVFSWRDAKGQWDPRRQRPEYWRHYNTRLNPGESIRVFPLSDWTELDVWRYIRREGIPVVPLYYAAMRDVVERDGQLLTARAATPGDRVFTRQCRFRTLGCYPCTAAVESAAASVDEVIAELECSRVSERATRVIDHDQDASMERKKREGYF